MDALANAYKRHCPPNDGLATCRNARVDVHFDLSVVITVNIGVIIGIVNRLLTSIAVQLMSNQSAY